MKNQLWIIIYFLILNIQLKAQINLIENGDFEDNVNCNLISLTYPWKQANCSPDIYYFCDTNFFPPQTFSVPSILGIYDYLYFPQNGNGFSGFYSLSKTYGQLEEAMVSPLKSQLKNTSQYYINYYTRATALDSISNSFSSSVDIAFSENEYYLTSSNCLIGKKLEYPEKNNLEINIDYKNWSKVHNKYVAKGNEKFVYFGFLPNRNRYTNTNFVQPNTYQIADNISLFEFNPLPDTLYLCNNKSITINAHFLDGTYLWNTGENDSIITVDKEGIYLVKVIMDSDLIFTDSVFVKNIDNLEKNNNILVCEETLNYLIESPIKAESYLWNNGDTTKSITVNQIGIYTLNVITNCGLATFTYNLEPRECRCDIKFPNAFTPNGDGKNDYFQALNYCDFPFKNFKFIILDRFGNKVYQTDKINDKGWDGLKNEIGSYFWYANYTNIINGIDKNNSQKGSLELIR